MAKIQNSEIKEWGNKVPLITSMTTDSLKIIDSRFARIVSSDDNFEFTLDLTSGCITQESYDAYITQLKTGAFIIDDNRFFKNGIMYDLNDYTKQIMVEYSPYDSRETFRKKLKDKLLIIQHTYSYIIDFKKELTYIFKTTSQDVCNLSSTLIDIDDDCVYGLYTSSSSQGGVCQYKIKNISTGEIFLETLINVCGMGSTQCYWLFNGKVYNMFKNKNNQIILGCYDYKLKKIWEVELQNIFYHKIHEYIIDDCFILHTSYGIYKININTGVFVYIIPTLTRRVIIEDKYSEMFSTFAHAFECISEMQKSIMDIEERFRK